MKLGLFLLVAVCTAVAHGTLETLQEEVNALTARVDEATCSPHIHVMVHRGGEHHHEHDEDSEDEEGDHEEHDHEGHAESEEDGDHEHGDEAEATGCNSHIHLHLGGRGGRDHAGHHSHDSDHHNTLMSDSDDPDSWLYAGAVLIPAVRRGPSGYVAMRQRLHGGDVEVKFRATGISMTGHDHDTMSHDHEVHVHQYGDCRRGCSKIGDGFHPTHSTTEHASEEGYLGQVQCNMAGTIDQTVTYTNEEISLVGAHGAIGRAIAIHAMSPSEDDQVTDPHEGHDHSDHGGHSENAIIMCGAIIYTNGQAWGDTTTETSRAHHWWFW